jgi:RNAse (barnase) inhibitor barstar
MSYEESQKVYREQLSIESLAANQINRIMEARSKKLTEYFEESVDALIDLLPPEIEETILEYKNINSIHYDLSTGGKEKYILLFREIKKQLHSCNIIWKRGVFDIGHD